MSPPPSALLTAPGALLTPAGRARPARYRDFLPADPGLRGTAIDEAVIGMTAADFDAPSRRLLRRAQDAVDAVTSAQVFRAGLPDRPATGLALAGQDWDIAVALREQARLRATRAGPAAAEPGPRAVAALGRQARAAQLAQASVADRITALERYAAEAGQAEVAYRDWTQAAAVAASGRRHLDMLARTAADEHGVAEIEDLSRQAPAAGKGHDLRDTEQPYPATEAKTGS